MSIEALRRKWTELPEDSPIEEFGRDPSTGSFLILYTDSAGGPCPLSVTTLGVFEDFRDALGFLRFRQLPEFEVWSETRAGGEPGSDALEPLERQFAGDHGGLRELLEAAIAAPAGAVDRAKVQEAFNEAFRFTNPSYAIEAWGSIEDVLQSEYAREHLAEESEGELAEIDGEAPALDSAPVTFVLTRARSGCLDLGAQPELEAAVGVLRMLEAF